MPELKRFLDAAPIQNRFAVLVFGAVSLFGVMVAGFGLFNVVSIGVFDITTLLMPLIMTVPFAAVAIFCFRSYRKSIHRYDDWWNGLSENERMEIMDDFEHANKAFGGIFTGTRYLYLLHAGEAVPYEEITNIYCSGRTHGCLLWVKTQDGKGHAVTFTTWRAGEQAKNELVGLCPNIIRHNPIRHNAN